MASGAGGRPQQQPNGSQKEQAKDAKEEEELVREREPIAWVPDTPDGGWGWVVVFATFMVHVIADGIVYSFGIMIVEFLAEFGESRGLTSWIISILTGLTLGAGPLAAAVTSRFGCRFTTILGSVIATIGCAISYFATSILYLVISVGVVMGLGFSLMYAPSIIMVTQYFDDRRALATGIAVCGAGIGTFLFSAFTSHLIEEFSWRGTFLIYAGFVLNCAVCGALFRPLPLRPVYSDVELEEMPKSAATSGQGSLEALANANGDPHSNTQQTILASSSDSAAASPASNGKLPSVSITEEDGAAVLANGGLDQQQPISRSVMALSAAEEATRLSRAASLMGGGKLAAGRGGGGGGGGHVSRRLTASRPRGASESQGMLGVPDVFYPGSLRNISRDYESNRDIYRSLAILHQEADVHASHQQKSPVKRLRIRSRSPSPPGEGLEAIQYDEDEESCWERALVEMRRMLSFSLLKDPIFLLFAVSNFLTSMGFNIPLLYLPDKATYALHIHKDLVGYIVGAFGVANTVGRILIGFVSDKQLPGRLGKDIKSNRLWIYNLSLVVCGILTCFNAFAQDFYSLAVYSGLFGFLISSYVCLTSVILVDLLGIDSLTNAFGLLLLFQGVSSVIGPPIGGWIVDASGGANFDYCFVFAGLNLMLSGLMLFVVPCLEKRVRSQSFIERRDYTA